MLRVYIAWFVYAMYPTNGNNSLKKKDKKEDLTFYHLQCKAIFCAKIIDLFTRYDQFTISFYINDSCFILI